MVAALALGGVLATGAATAITQLVRSTDRVETTMLALHNLDMAGRWVSLDGRMAQATDLVDGALPMSTMTLYRTDLFGGEPVDYTTTYSLMGNELQRNHNGQVTVVARSISTANFSLEGETIIATLASSAEGVTYRLYMRGW